MVLLGMAGLRRLEVLDLSGCVLQLEDARALALLLAGCVEGRGGGMRRLILRNCRIEEACAEALAAGLKGVRALEVLDVSCNALRVGGCRSLMQALQPPTGGPAAGISLRRLLLARNDITAEAADDLERTLKASVRLEECDLRGNALLACSVRLCLQSAAPSACTCLFF